MHVSLYSRIPGKLLKSLETFCGKMDQHAIMATNDLGGIALQGEFKESIMHK